MDQQDSFFSTVKNCLYNPNYFQHLVSKTFSSALKYLYLLLVLTLYISSIKSAIVLIPKASTLPPMVQNIKEFVQMSYPAELIVTVKNGELSTNVKEPYYIELPSKDKKTTNDFHLIVIDTQAHFEDFAKYKTGALITKTGVITRDKNNSLKVYPFEKNYNFVLNKNKYDQMTNKFLPYVNYLPTIIVLTVGFFILFGPFLTALFIIIGWLIYVLFIGLLFFIVAKILKKELTYKKIYILSLYGLTLPVILEALTILIPAQVLQIYNIFPKLLYFILMIIVIVKYENGTNTPVVSSPTPTITI